jgi:RHS repeat-associated protein
LLVGLTLGLRAQPLLEIALRLPDGVVLSWTRPGFQLESTDSLDEPVLWKTVAEQPSEFEGRLILSVQATLVASHFRLREIISGLPPDPATIAPMLATTETTSFASATSFLFSGSNPVQRGLIPGSIVAERACVARGLVSDPAGDPIPGVAVSVLNHPELGQTLSRPDGRFDLALNGGGPVVLQFAKSGLLPVQRQIQSRWQDYVAVPDIILMPLDPVVTPVTLGAGSPMQTARGSVQLDPEGARQATVVLPAGTSASLVLADGTLLPMDTLHIRATEYTVGTNGLAAMPATLPANVGYTYCVELSADEAIQAGAREVRFDRPLAFYVENFIGFPVGMAVPTGYYDRVRALWVPSPNGRVVQVTGILNNLAALDTDGDGAPDGSETLAGLGITEEELGQLASLYPSGTTLWRVPVTHFTPWDCNWPYGPPAGAVPPPPPLPPTKPSGATPDPDKDCGSLIEVQNQVLIESVPMKGTPFSLNYRSDRAPGRTDLHTLDLAVSGSQVPATVKRINLEIEVAGQIHTATFPPQPNQRHKFVWDRHDAYGRPVSGPQMAIVRVGYVYGAVYQVPAAFQSAFGMFAEIPMTASRDLLEITLLSESTAPLEGFPVDPAGLGHWTVNVHHGYAPATQVLYLGDGGRRTASVASSMVLSTVALDTEIPSALAAGPDGSLYIAHTVKDANNNNAFVVRRMGPDGVIRPFAGSGQALVGNDEGPASNAKFGGIQAMALGRDGSLFIFDNRIILRVSPDGMISTVIGDRSIGTISPDGTLASQAKVGFGYFLAAASDGSLYFDEIDDPAHLHRIRRIGPDGILRTVAGAGTGGNTSLPIAASLARFPDSSVLRGTGGAIGPDDTLYLTAGALIRRLGSDGILRPLTGQLGDIRSTGDGGSAINATLTWVKGLAVGRDGSVFASSWKSFNSTIADYRVRQIGADGIIRTVAGNGTLASPQDGPATQVSIVPYALAVGPDGSVFVANYTFGRIQKLSRIGIREEADELWVPSENGAEVYVFTAEGRHLRTLDGLTGGTRYQFSYGQNGLLSSIQDAHGNTTTILRTPNGRATAIRSPRGGRTEVSMNNAGLLAGVTPPGGVSISFIYDAGGLLTQRTDSGNSLHAYTYDSQGRLVLDQGPDGGFRRLNRTDSASGFTVTVSSAAGLTNRYSIEGLPAGGQRRTRIDPAQLKSELTEGTDGSFTHRAPDGMVIRAVQGRDPLWGMAAPVLQSLTLATPGGLTNAMTSLTRAGLVNASTQYPLGFTSLTHVVTLNGQGFTNTFDPVNRTLTRATPVGRKITTTLTASGEILRQTSTGLHPTEYLYDAEGRVREAIVGEGEAERRWAFSYNAAGQVVQWIYPNGQMADSTHDAQGRTIARTYPGGRTIEFTYDNAGNTTSVKPAGKPAHRFAYSASDLTTAYFPPGAPEVHFAHDSDGRLARFTRGDGQFVDFDYGASDCHCGKLQSVTDSLGLTTYSYSHVTGNLTSILKPSGGNNQYEYDGSLMTRETWSGAVTGSVARTYTTDFRVASRSVNGTASITYLRDKDGLLVQSGSLSLTRDRNHGKVTATTLQNVSDQSGFNRFGEIEVYTASHQGSSLLNLIWTRDQVGQITRRIETLDGVTTTNDYTYDVAGRLAEVRQDDAVVEVYTYDANGNRLTSAGNGTSSADYDDSDALTTWFNGSATRFTYNGHLELIERVTGNQTNRYAYSALGHLHQAVLPDGTEIDYVLDGRNRRIGKRRNGTLVQGFLYQDQWRPIAELDGSNAVVSRFIYATHPHVPAYLIRGGVNFRLITDAIGSVRLVVNAGTGEVVQRMTYDAFGQVLEDTNPGFQPFGFAGGLYDQDTHWVHFGFREYDSGTGRWTTRDPLLFGGRQMNFFAYAGNDPVNRIDPAGLASIEASAYAGPGGGIKIGIDAQGISLCGEIGLGVGMGLSVDPFEGIDSDSTSLIAEASGALGPLSGSLKGELDDCGRISGEAKTCLGPLCAKGKKTLGEDGSEVSGELAGGDELGDRISKIAKDALKGLGAKLEGKIAGKFCVQHKW